MYRRDFLKLTGAAFAVSGFAGACSPVSNKSKLPNIVYILADDMGFGDIQCQNPESKYPTPNLDRLAKQGCRFTDTHTNSAVCTPTRYGILTGRYSFRTSLKKGVLNGMSKPLIPSDRMTVASMLKDRGYYTACVGKWHLGMNIPVDETKKSDKKKNPRGWNVDATKSVTGGPVDVGFDTFFGIPASLDMPPYMYIHDRDIVEAPTAPASSEEFKRRGHRSPSFRAANVLGDLTRHASGIIKKHSEINSAKPLFVYLPFTAPHTPVKPAKEFQGRTDSEYGDFVVEVDHRVGEIMKALDDAGIADNTLLIFTADNGASPNAAKTAIENGHTPNKPWRGGKTHVWEGGHRVPFFVRWPGKVKTNSVCDDLYCVTDLMATCADIAGVKLPDNAGEDSVSMLESMLGKKQGDSDRIPVIHHAYRGQFAIRHGKYKLICCQGGGGWDEKDWGMPILPIDESVPGQLYDTQNDIYEEKNLYKEKPEIVSKLARMLVEIIDNGRSTPGSKQKNSDPEDCRLPEWVREL